MRYGIMQYFTKENFTLAIALVGAIGTIASWVYAFLSTRKRLAFKLVSSYTKNNTFISFVMIENKSRLPISINAISLILNEDTIMCGQIPTKILEITNRSGQEVTDRRKIFTMQFPISLAALSGASGYIFFELKGQEINNEEKLLTMLGTNRGKPITFRVVPNYVEKLNELY